MLSNIGRAAVRRIGGGQLSTNRFLVSLQSQRVEAFQNANSISKLSLNSFLARRSYATATRTKTKTKTATKKPAAKKATKTTKAAKKPATKKKTAKKPVKKTVKKKTKAKAKPKPKVPRKPAGERVILYRQKQVAKELTLLEDEPKPKPESAFNLYMYENSKGGNKTLAEVAKAFKTISVQERERLNHDSNQNKTANTAAYNKWVRSLKPEQIRIANIARKRLRALTKRSVPRTIVDDRLPVRPRTAMIQFSMERHHSGDFKGVPIGDAGKRISEEWKALSTADRKVYEDRTIAEKNRYEKEYQTVFGHPSKPYIGPNYAKVSEFAVPKKA